MRALTVVPLKGGSAGVVDVDEPAPGPGDLLVDGLALGVCGTDREIAAGEYGWAPPGRERLILGHEDNGVELDDALAEAPRIDGGGEGRHDSRRRPAVPRSSVSQRAKRPGATIMRRLSDRGADPRSAR